MSEKNLNFDQPVERRGTHSLKYDFAEEREGDDSSCAEC